MNSDRSFAFVEKLRFRLQQGKSHVHLQLVPKRTEIFHVLKRNDNDEFKPTKGTGSDLAAFEDAINPNRNNMLPSPQPIVFLFVHGFNNSEDDAILFAAQLTKSLGFSNQSVVFEWPSAEGLFSYLYDLQSTNFSRDQLAALIGELSKESRLHIFAHSMGCWLTMEALRQTALAGDAVVLNNIEDIFLIAPDVDRDVFWWQLRDIQAQQRYAGADNLTGKITILAGTDDNALKFSSRFSSRNPFWVSSKSPLLRVGMMDEKQIEKWYGQNSYGVKLISTSKVPDRTLMHHKKALLPEVVISIRKSLLGQPQSNQSAFASANEQNPGGTQ